MGLGYLLGGGIRPEPQGPDSYRAFPVMRDLYAQTADWTSLPVSLLLDDELPREPRRARASAPCGGQRRPWRCVAGQVRPGESGPQPGAVLPEALGTACRNRCEAALPGSTGVFPQLTTRPVRGRPAGCRAAPAGARAVVDTERPPASSY
jgi:hypothetical protein